MKKIIAVAGLGYVGLSMATLLAQNNRVLAVDVSEEKVAAVNNRQSPIQDEYIEKFFAERKLDLTATTDAQEAYAAADFVIIAVPTNYDPKKNFFDTSAVHSVIEKILASGSEAYMVIKSTIPVGFVKSASPKLFTTTSILRESSSAQILTTPRSSPKQMNSPNFFWRAQSKKIFRR